MPVVTKSNKKKLQGKQEEYSQKRKARNARNRKARMTPKELEVEKEKDRKKHQISYALKVLRKTSDFLKASKNRQDEMVAQTRLNIEMRQSQKALKAKNLVQNNDNPVSESESDDSETDFEGWEVDIDEKEEEEEEESDDKEENNEVRELEKIDLKDLNINQELKQAVGLSGILIWIRAWKASVEQFMTNLKSLNEKIDEESSDFSWVKDSSGVYLYPNKLPHKIFSRRQRAVWRNLASWSSDILKLEGESDIKLPGPEEWWTSNKSYDPKRHGFWIPKDGVRYKRAWNLLHYTEWKEDLSQLLKEFEETPEAMAEDNGKWRNPDDYFLF